MKNQMSLLAEVKTQVFFRAAFVKQDLKTVKSTRIKCPSSLRENRWAIL